MKIVNMNKYSLKDVTFKKCFAIINQEGNFLSLDGKTIYLPIGGRCALKELLKQQESDFYWVPLNYETIRKI